MKKNSFFKSGSGSRKAFVSNFQNEKHLKEIIQDNNSSLIKDKIFKPLNVSSKILLWDQYIPISLAKIDKKTKQMTKNRYYHDYCNTLRFLEDELFKRSNNFFSLTTMNYSYYLFLRFIS